MYSDLYLDPRRHVCLHLCLCLNLNLDLNLNLAPYTAPNRASFRKLFGKPNPALYRRLCGFMYQELYDSVYLAPFLKPWPPIRPLPLVFRTCQMPQPADNTVIMVDLPVCRKRLLVYWLSRSTTR